jgi:hypothetical protein
MNPKKQKEKERRRARKLSEQAWEAVDGENLDLAEKIIRRAVATQPDNPVLWNDQGMVLGLKQKEVEAEESFRTALRLAPDYAEPYAHLAALRARQGYLKQAIALQQQAVKYAPQTPEYVARLEAYQSLAEQGAEPHVALREPSNEEGKVVTSTESTKDASGKTVRGLWSEQLAKLDRQLVSDQLTREGCVLIPNLVDAETCARLRSMFEDDSLFAKTVVMDQPHFGQGVYRYFRAPIPEDVDGLRRSVYPHVARIANHWQRLLGEPRQYPDEWEEFRKECHDAGQTTPTPILLKYGPGGFNALHRDLRGTVFFPIQMAVVLSRRDDPSDPTAEGFTGGEFLFCDVPEREKSRRRVVPAGLGDTLLFCTRDRLVRIGGVYGLQPVKHGVDQITHGTRYVLGVPFHEYR